MMNNYNSTKPQEIASPNLNKNCLISQVSITPNGAWGGEGSIGCGIGYGYLHRIPIEDIPQPGSNVAASMPSSVNG